jgi:hypothetical protein
VQFGSLGFYCLRTIFLLPYIPVILADIPVGASEPLFALLRGVDAAQRLVNGCCRHILYAAVTAGDRQFKKKLSASN